jgi:hypothetical protein
MSLFRASASRFARLGLGLSLALGVLSTAIVTEGAGFISVPASGIGPLTFDLVANPTPTNGFSTQTIGGAGNSVNDPNAMNTAVPTNDIANINLILPQSNTQPPSTQAFARYNYGGFFLQTRPTGNAYTILVGSFRNDSGADRNSIILTYDQGFAQSGGTEQVPGLWVYYSLTGAPGTWQKLDSLSGQEGTLNMATNVTLNSSWEVGANLYILWADDNADGFTDGNFTIDNLSLSFQTTPVSISTQPHDITVETCHGSNLTVVATGSGPITYQWYKGNIGSPVTGGTGATLSFNNPQLSDAGNYFVRVTGPGTGNFVDSTPPAVVTVNQDATQPDVVSAIARADGTNITVTFSEPMFAPTTGNPDSYLLHPTDGGSDTIPLSATLNTAGTVLTLAFTDPRGPTTEYELIVDGSVSDACGNPLSGNSIPLHYEIHLISFDNEAWKYDHSGVDLGIDWYNSGYDDSSWSNGISVLDAKNPARTTVGGRTVMTQLTLHNAAYPTDDIPVYYFRKFFNLPVGLSHISAVSLRTFVDDFDVAYLNDNPTPVHIRAGNPVTPDTYGYSGGAAVGDAGVEGPFNIPVSALVEGQNFIAAKLFQQALGSSDITFAYELTAVVDTLSGGGAGPQLSVSKDPNTGAVSITWAAGSGATLYEADAVDAPAGSWSAVAGASDGSYSFTPPAIGGTQKFYVLRK